MRDPVVNVARLREDIIHEDETSERWLDFIQKSILAACRELIREGAPDVSSFDVRAVVTPQMTPLVTCDGIVIGLDIGDEAHGDYDERDKLRSVIYHEVFHLADRFDPAFRVDYFEDAERRAEKIRKPVNAVWDIYIERRKFERFGMMPITWYSYGSNPAQTAEQAQRQLFLGLASPPEAARAAFEKVWQQPVWTHPQLVELARTIAVGGRGTEEGTPAGDRA